MNYYPFHIGDFRSGCIHMSPLERWLYRDMLDVMYDTEKPLPTDLEALYRLVGAKADEHKAAVVSVLEAKFIRTESGYTQVRVSEELARYKKKGDNAKHANNVRWGKTPNSIQSDPDQIPTSNQEPVTSNQEPKKTTLSGRPDDSQVIQAKEVLQYLNARSNCNFREVAANLDLIKACLETGATVDQCKQVINAKLKEWSGLPDMNRYLRPKTLFKLVNFEQYLGALGLANAPLFERRVI